MHHISTPFYLHSSVADSFLQTDIENLVVSLQNRQTFNWENRAIYSFILLFQAQNHYIMLNPNRYIDNFVWSTAQWEKSQETNFEIIFFEFLIFFLFVYLSSVLLGKKPSDCHSVYEEFESYIVLALGMRGLSLGENISFLLSKRSCYHFIIICNIKIEYVQMILKLYRHILESETIISSLIHINIHTVLTVNTLILNELDFFGITSYSSKQLHCKPQTFCYCGWSALMRKWEEWECIE